MTQSVLLAAAAQYALGMMSSEELARAADEAIDDGAYSPDLADVAASTQPIWSDIAPLFERALAELNITLPPPDDSAEIVVRHITGKIAEGRVTPRLGALQLKKLHDAVRSHCGAEIVLGEAYGIQHLLGSHYGYDHLDGLASDYPELAGPDAFRELDENVIRFSRDWLAGHPCRE
jgi:hypothetical protein